jgi:purine-nucleoside phosphorylase
MYTSVNVEAFKKRTGLPADYTVDGFLAAGTWDLYANSRHIPHLKQALETLQIDTVVTRIEGEELGHAFEFMYDGKRYWFVPVMGTAVMSQYAHIACLLGSRKNLLAGVVGGLKPGMKPADFIVPSASKGNENALMYQRKNTDLFFYPDKALADSLKARLGEMNVYEGITTTCEVMFAETAEDVRTWSKQGYLGVEMEAALIFALSKSFGIPAASILYVADNLIEDITIFHESYDTSKAAREKAKLLKYTAVLAELLELPH